MEIEYLQNSILLKQSNFFHFIFIGIGLLAFLIGVLGFKKLKNGKQYIMPVFGLMFFFVGLLVWLNNHQIQIDIQKDKKQVLIEEKFGRESLKSFLPYTYFSHIELSRQVSVSNSGSRSSKSIHYEVALISTVGTAFTLLSEQSKKDVQEFIQKLAQYCPEIPVYLLYGKQEDYKEFFDELKAKNPDFILSEEYPIKITKEISTKGLTLEMPKNTILEGIEEKDKKVFIWRNTSNWASVITFGILIGLFFAIIHLSVLPKYGWRLQTVLAYFFLSIFFITFLLTLLNTFLGKYKLQVSEKGIKYHTEIFGTEWFPRKIPQGELAIIRGQIVSTEEQQITLFTKAGEEFIKTLIQDSPEAAFMKIGMVVLNMEKYLITKDVSTLSISQQIFLIETLKLKIE